MMNLVIMGAGESPRIKAEGLKIPKHLVRIGGEYLIERIIRIGLANGIKKVYCIINSNELIMSNTNRNGSTEQLNLETAEYASGNNR